MIEIEMLFAYTLPVHQGLLDAYTMAFVVLNQPPLTIHRAEAWQSAKSGYKIWERNAGAPSTTPLGICASFSLLSVLFKP